MGINSSCNGKSDQKVFFGMNRSEGGVKGGGSEGRKAQGEGREGSRCSSIVAMKNSRCVESGVESAVKKE